MKLIALIVFSFAVLTVNCRDISDGGDHSDGPDISDDSDNHSNGVNLSDDHNMYNPDESDDEAFTSEPEPFSGGDGDKVISIDVDAFIPIVEPGPVPVQGGSSNINYLLNEDDRIQNEQKLRGSSKCKSDIVCSLLGGSCVTNSTYCSGREVPSVCNGAKCKCCIPVTLEVKVHDLETKLQSMVVNLTVANSNLNTQMNSKLDSIIKLITSNLTISNSNLDLKIDFISSNFTDTNSDIRNEVQFIKENLTNTNAILDSKLHSIKEDQGCPDGLFLFTPTNQCFRLLNDTTRSWYTAITACSALGLQMAQPYNPISLRSYMLAKYGLTSAIWLGARGDGSYIRWQRTGTYISSSNPLWYSGRPGTYVSSSYCLRLMTYESWLKSYPTTPYYNSGCSGGYWALCELVSE